MRLLHTKELRWIELSENVPPYAILSHRWLSKSSEEVSFQDLQSKASDDEIPHINADSEDSVYLDACTKEGLEKLKESCNLAWQDGLDYIWIDTCCIDKTSSAELSEAINSMHAWYKGSAVCYVYLHDVDHTTDQDALKIALRNAEWFKRGWTLQELIAPCNVFFFAKNWSRIGSRATWVSILSEITRIREEILLGKPCKPSIAERMSWAVGRKTQKIEDRAYSLMGIFDIHMPIIYGEGEKAFRRLQLEIMKSSDDQTIFAWHDSVHYPDLSETRGVLATTPDSFWWGSSHPLVNIDHSLSIRHQLHSSRWHSFFGSLLSLEDGYTIQNDGIHINLPIKQEGDSWLAVLKCKTDDQELPYGIFLRETLPGSNIFLRSATMNLPQLERRDIERLEVKKIRMAIDYDAPPISPRRGFFTFRSAGLDWDQCNYYICPTPNGHGSQLGGGRQVLDSDTRIKLENSTECCCVTIQDRREVVVLFIGIEDHRPWIHLLTNPNLHRHIDISPTRSPSESNNVPTFVTSQLTSEPSREDADPIPLSRLSATSRSASAPNNHRAPQNRSKTLRPVLFRAPGSGCAVCTIVQQEDINIGKIKDSRADLLTATISSKQIEVDVRKGPRAGTMKHELEVEYVITITVDSSDPFYVM